MTVVGVPESVPSYSSLLVNEVISEILEDMGQPGDSTGFWSRKDVLRALNNKQREISTDTENILYTPSTFTLGIGDTEVTVDSPGDLLRVWDAARVYGGVTQGIAVYSTIEQIAACDYQWRTRTGSTLRAILSDYPAEGRVRPYPIMDNASNQLIVTYVKNAALVSAELTEAGDASNQLTNWILDGVTTSNTDAYQLYWNLTNSVSTRTVSLYKAVGKAAGDKVAEGTLSGDGTLTLTEQNNSGISGTVDVTYTTNDTDSANILTMNQIEIPIPDVPCLKDGIKGELYGLEKDGKDAAKATYYLGLYEQKKERIRERVRKKRSSTYQVFQERPTDDELQRTRPYYPWEI